MNIDQLSSPELLYEMDKGTISESARIQLLDELAELGLEYVDYNIRTPEIMRIVATEVKREIDRNITKRLEEALQKLSITEGRFDKLYTDVRLYPRTRELEKLDHTDWAGLIIDVYVSFVISVPPDDSLDTMTRIQLVSFFSEDPNISESEKDEIGEVELFHENLNMNMLVSTLTEIRFPGFYGEDFGGVALEIIVDACPESNFPEMADAAKKLGQDVPDCFTQQDPKKPDLPIEPDQVDIKVPQLIAAMAKELGVSKINPALLERSHSLFSIMGFDDPLTLSLSQSLLMQFDVVHVVGGGRLVTVGNVIDFVTDHLESDYLEDMDYS